MGLPRRGGDGLDVVVSPSPRVLVSESVSATPAANAARAYLALFPLAHLLPIPVGGAMSTGSDLLSGLLLLVWVWDVVVRKEGRERVRAVVAGSAVPGMPSRAYFAGIGVLLAFGVWVGLSGLWGFHPVYAGAKGAGTVSLALVALVLATSGLGWRRAADAWLVGAGATLLATLLLWFAGPSGARDAVSYYGGGVQGLPFPRISGPFLHPNMFGDYLLVSAFLLLGRGPEWTGRARKAGVALGVGLACALALTASTALVGGGLAAVWIGSLLFKQRSRQQGVGLALGGGALAAGTLAFVIFPQDVRVLGLELVGGGMRPEIWRSSLQAVLQAPLLGVGAAPYLAQAADPLYGGSVGFWDAHNAYLSVVGQFGAVGGILMALGIGLTLRGFRAAPLGPLGRGSRSRLALGLAVAAVAVNALFLASEDLRHVWVLVGMLGVAASESGS